MKIYAKTLKVRKCERLEIKWGIHIHVFLKESVINWFQKQDMEPLNGDWLHKNQNKGKRNLKLI